MASSPTAEKIHNSMSLHQFCTMASSLKYKVTAVLLLMCTLGIMIDFWITERYVDNSYVHSLQNVGTFKANTLWSHLMFFAASDKEDLGVAFKPENTSDEAYDTHCQVPRLDDHTKHPPFVTCKRPQPIRGSCEVANKVFFSEPTPTCAHQETHIICRIQSTASLGHFVNCSNNICPRTTSMGVIDRSSGSLTWIQMQSITSLEKAIHDLLQRNESNGNYGFCFLSCQLTNKTTARQLLLLPKYFSQNVCKDEVLCNRTVNINVIWLDSTSHSHFYRSMPKSVHTLRNIKKHKLARVFSYNLMQSMSGGTYVNTAAFTSGKISQRQDLLKKHVGIGDLFSIFKKRGYHITWIDDLCWTWSIAKCACGIPKFLGEVLDKKKSTVNAWKGIQSKLFKKGVDQIDISLSNCEIMRANNITDPFRSSNKSVAICYNGFYQTHYLLSSLEMLQTQLSSTKRPFFHYLDLNLGHEASGRRIQTLDKSLAKFVNFLSGQDNTLTLMFGDHGNKYGTFVKQTKESKIEMAHTVLFVLASNNLQEKLGKEKMDALDINQNRLVNILDLRQTVLTLAPAIDKKHLTVDKKFDVHQNGLFHPISPKRSCESMKIAPEAGKCICEKGQVNRNAVNDTRVTVMADLALGEINNKIQEQFMHANFANRTLGFGSCQRLIGRWISEVQETIIENVIVTELNVHVPAGSSAPQSEDIFSFAIHVTSNTPDTSIKLVHFERITTYAVYDECRDNGVDGDLCVCSPSNVSRANQSKNAHFWHLQPQVVFGHMTTVVGLNDCLFIHERRTPYGLILEASCDCIDTEFLLVVYIGRRLNVVSSMPLPSVIQLNSGMIIFIGAFHQLHPLKTWQLDYDVKFRPTTIISTMNVNEHA